MLEQVKKLSVIITIAILFSVLVFSIAELIVEQPEYGDFCRSSVKPNYLIDSALSGNCSESLLPEDEFIADCQDNGGFVRYDYDDKGCVADYECDTCSSEYQAALSNYRMVMFLVSSFLGLLAVIAGLYMKPKNDIMEWIYSGFIIGGLASIFIGTVSYFNDMDRLLRPLVMIAEIALVIWVGIKTTSNSRQKTTKSKK
ncbi:MAG: hypothetical protein ACLFPQ_02160 [Candidatus Woesearchaeota archaeon]